MMRWLRSVVGVVAGYVLFAAPAFAVFQIAGQPAHAPASIPVMLVSTLCGMAFAVAGGYLAGVVAGRHPLAHAGAMACLLALGAGVSLASTVGHGAIWSQAAALALMAPGAVVGGWLRQRSARATLAARNGTRRTGA